MPVVSDGQEIRKLIQERAIKYITLDSNIFIKYNFKFDHGILYRLKQFSDTDHKLIISNLIKREVINDMAKRSFAAEEKFSKSLEKRNKESLAKDTHKILESYNPLQEDEHQKLAFKYFDSFLKECDYEEIHAEDENYIEDIFDAYFRKMPPFKTEKKSEFPDAFALFSMENIANKEDCKIIVVSEDKDWHSFCYNSNNLYLVKDIKDALSYFQKIDIKKIEKFKMELVGGYYEFIDNEIKKELENTYNSESIDIDVASSMPFECDVEKTEIKGFEYDEEIDFDVIEESGDLVSITVTVDVTLELYISIQFYVIDGVDKDFIPINRTNFVRERCTPATLIITLRNFGGEIKIKEVEVIEHNSAFDIEEVEPDL